MNRIIFTKQKQENDFVDLSYIYVHTFDDCVAKQDFKEKAREEEFRCLVLCDAGVTREQSTPKAREEEFRCLVLCGAGVTREQSTPHAHLLRDEIGLLGFYSRTPTTPR